MDSHGKFVSHVDRKSQPISQRNKNDPGKEGLVHIELPIFEGKKLRLQLSKNRKFVAPGLVIEKEGQVRHFSSDCHYYGLIEDQPNSSASISYCQGLVSPKLKLPWPLLITALAGKSVGNNRHKDVFTWCDIYIYFILLVLIDGCLSRRAQMWRYFATFFSGIVNWS